MIVDDIRAVRITKEGAKIAKSAMRRHRYAKTVATVRPASASPDRLRELFFAGVDTFRLNFSHGTREGRARVHAAIRALKKDIRRPIGILQDMQGPKIRIGAAR
jgi:pyruvate kinase